MAFAKKSMTIYELFYFFWVCVGFGVSVGLIWSVLAYFAKY